MLTLKQILAHIQLGYWFITVDMKDAYFHIHITPRHRPFLRFKFESVAYKYAVPPIGLSLAPRTFTKCIDAALAPIWNLNYLNHWLVIAQSERQLLAHRDLMLFHMQQLGLRVNYEKNMLMPNQHTAFLGTTLDSSLYQAWMMLVWLLVSPGATQAYKLPQDESSISGPLLPALK